MAGPTRGSFTHHAFLSNTTIWSLLMSDFADIQHPEISGVVLRAGISKNHRKERLLISGHEKLHHSQIQYSPQSTALLLHTSPSFTTCQISYSLTAGYFIIGVTSTSGSTWGDAATVLLSLFCWDRYTGYGGFIHSQTTVLFLVQYDCL